MKFSCTRENLKRGLMATGYVAGKNVNLPILNNVLIRIDGNTIQLVSTNLEVAVRCAVRGKVEAAGEFTVPSKLFLDYVSLLPDDRVDMEVADGTLKIACRKNATKIKGVPASEFPLIPEVDRRKVLFLTGATMRRVLDQVTFAVSNAESRPELTGALFNVNPSFAPGKLIVAATDSYRLSEKTVPLEKCGDRSSTDQPAMAIIPGKTLNELSRILALYKDGDLQTESVEIALGEGQVAFKFGDIEVVSRLVDGRYPDYRPIIPERYASEAVFQRSEAVQAVKGASLFSRAGLQDVHFRLEKDGLVVSSSDGQMGKNDSVVESDLSGSPNAITLNYRYFLDGLGAVDGAKARMKVVDAMNPCLIVSEDSDSDREEKFQYIVMPIKQ